MRTWQSGKGKGGQAQEAGCQLTLRHVPHCMHCATHAVCPTMGAESRVNKLHVAKDVMLGIMEKLKEDDSRE